MQRATIGSIGHYLVPSPEVTQVTSNSVVERVTTKSAQHPPISDSVAATTPKTAPQANRRGGSTTNGGFARPSNATGMPELKQRSRSHRAAALPLLSLIPSCGGQ